MILFGHQPLLGLIKHPILVHLPVPVLIKHLIGDNAMTLLGHLPLIVLILDLSL